MRDILAPAQRAFLDPFAWSRTLLAFGFDGALAPRVDSRHEASLRPATKSLLSVASTLYPCIILSGRAVSEVASRVPGAELKAIIGRQGLGRGSDLPSLPARALEWKPRLESVLRSEAGVAVEERASSVAVNLGRSRAKKRVRRLVRETAAAFGEVRLIDGPECLCLVPGDSSHKGLVLERERARLRCDTAIYVGDGEGDEDIFALDQPGRLLAIRVGREDASMAHFYLKTQAHIDTLLRELIRLRRDSRAFVETLAS